MMIRTLIIAALLMSIADAAARDPAQVRAFRKENPCPATGKVAGACPGYVVDHIVPLCSDGADHPNNMIWQTRAESLEKDRTEWALCRWIHRLRERKAAQ